jgi:hypothetical protein
MPIPSHHNFRFDDLAAGREAHSSFSPFGSTTFLKCLTAQDITNHSNHSSINTINNPPPVKQTKLRAFPIAKLAELWEIVMIGN